MRQHLTVQRQMVLLKEWYAELKKGLSALLVQSGLQESRWAEAMECTCHLRNIQDLLSDGQKPYERRFGEPPKGPIIPFGSMIEITLYLPKTCQDSTSSVRRFYLEYSSAMSCMRVESGRETFLVADSVELEKMDASEIHAGRLNAKEVLTPKMVKLSDSRSQMEQ